MVFVLLARSDVAVNDRTNFDLDTTTSTWRVFNLYMLLNCSLELALVSLI